MNKKVLTLLLIWRFTDHYLSKLPKDVLKYLVKDMYWDYFTGVAYCGVSDYYSFNKLSKTHLHSIFGYALYYSKKQVGIICRMWRDNDKNILIFAKIKSDYKIKGLTTSFTSLKGVKSRGTPILISVSVSEIPKDEICKQINYL